jgi:peptidoglycan hydrolase-like protein with peptidoglycan-binding domain
MPRPNATSRWTRSTIALLLLALAPAAGCKRQTAEERGRDAMERVQKSMVDLEAIALEQKTEPAVVEEIQRNLTAINEYQGEINGKLDSVTVNAIQSFQRTIGCPTMDWWTRLRSTALGRCIADDGIINPVTREKLAAAAAQAKK